MLLVVVLLVVVLLVVLVVLVLLLLLEVVAVGTPQLIGLRRCFGIDIVLIDAETRRIEHVWSVEHVWRGKEVGLAGRGLGCSGNSGGMWEGDLFTV